MFGFLNVNKPSGITSNKIITILRKITKIKQIGHGGTLDPLASGVLPVAIGKASKLIDYLPQNKSYSVGMYLGKTSDTYDIEGNIQETGQRKITKKEIEDILNNNFIGEINQIPPAFSAVHYNGKRLYELARKGQIPNDIPSRKINIYKNEIIDFDYDKQILKLDISCSKGTYIRSIVNDIGNISGSGAVMFELKRTLSSDMKINEAIDISENTDIEYIKENIINPIKLINLPTYEINDNESKIVCNGNKLKNTKNYKGDILIIKCGIIIALGYAENEFIQPKKVLL